TRPPPTRTRTTHIRELTVAVDQNKLAQLQALAEGGTPGLAAHQQAQQSAQNAKNQALAQAAGFGTANYQPGIGGTLAGIAGQAAQPGVNAAEQVAAT